MKTESTAQLTTTQAVDTGAAQIITANGQTYSVLPQAQMQTVTLDGQEAIYIPASIQHAVNAASANQQHALQLAGGQTLITHSGQILRAPTNIIQGVQAVAPNQVSSAAAQNAAVASSGQLGGAQVVQFGVQGVQQASIPVQIPISTPGGGTILQTISIPLQMPNVVQANGGAIQVLPQLAQMPAAQAQPQIAQILLPNGQIQQVQMMSPASHNVSAIPGMVSLSAASMGQLAAASNQNVTTSNWTTSTVTTPTITIPQTSIAANAQGTDDKTPQTAQVVTGANASQILSQTIGLSSQIAETVGAAGVTVVPVSQTAAAVRQAAAVAGQNNFSFPLQVIQPIMQHIPGLGQVQVISPSALASLNGTQPLTVATLNAAQAQSAASFAGQLLPGGAQIISTGLQPDSETKWILQTNPGQIGQSTILTGEVAQETPKTRLRRVACTCPNCKDTERSTDSTRRKVHVCHIPGCNKMYGKTSHLRAHLRWHSGERPFACNWIYCSKKFTRSDELQRHKRTHTGDKRFQCAECDKKFMRSDHLSKHMKTHAKKKLPMVSVSIGLESPTTNPLSDSGSSSDNDDNILTILPESVGDFIAIKNNHDMDKDKVICNDSDKVVCIDNSENL